MTQHEGTRERATGSWSIPTRAGTGNARKTATTPGTLYTIGHSTRTARELIEWSGLTG